MILLIITLFWGFENLDGHVVVAAIIRNLAFCVITFFTIFGQFTD